MLLFVSEILTTKEQKTEDMRDNLKLRVFGLEKLVIKPRLSCAIYAVHVALASYTLAHDVLQLQKPQNVTLQKYTNHRFPRCSAGNKFTFRKRKLTIHTYFRYGQGGTNTDTVSDTKPSSSVETIA